MEQYNFEDSEEMIRIVNENNRRLREKNSKVDVRTNRVRRDNKNRNKLRIRNMICASTLIAAIGFSAGLGANAGMKHLKNEIDLNQAAKYMENEINYICPSVERGVLSDGTVVFLDNNDKNYYNICESLQSEYKMSRNCAIYAIAKKYGDEAFSKVVTNYGYKDKDDFLYELYKKNVSISSSGETPYVRTGSFRVFENNVQVEYVNKVNEIQNMVEQKSLESKGMTK